MSTRAIIAYRIEPSRWKGVWNHHEGHTQYLGQELIKRVATFDGDLVRLTRQYIERCPEGWSSLQRGERLADPCGFLYGSVAAASKAPGSPSSAAVSDGIGLDTNYLYLFDLESRTLSVFESSATPIPSFGQVIFDPTGVATPPQLPPVGE